MISVWNLLWIVPLSMMAGIGILIVSFANANLKKVDPEDTDDGE